VFRLRVRQVIALLALLSQVVTTAFAHVPVELTKAMSSDVATMSAGHCHGDEHASPPTHSQHDSNTPCKHGAACKCPCAHFPALAV